MKRKVGKFIGGGIGLASIPIGFGVYDWRILLGAVVVGGIGGVCGVDVARRVKGMMARRKK